MLTAGCSGGSNGDGGGDTDGSSLSSMRTFVEAGDARFAMLFTEEDSCPDSVENQACQTLPSLGVDVQNVGQIIAFSGGPYHRIFAGPPDIPDARHQYLCEKITEAIEHPSFEQAAEEAERPILYGDCDLARKGLDQTVQTYEVNKDFLRDLGVM